MDIEIKEETMSSYNADGKTVPCLARYENGVLVAVFRQNRFESKASWHARAAA